MTMPNPVDLAVAHARQLGLQAEPLRVGAIVTVPTRRWHGRVLEIFGGSFNGQPVAVVQLLDGPRLRYADLLPRLQLVK